MATDNVKPTATDLSLKLSSITANSITIKWSPATDNVTAPKNIFYALYRYDVVYKPGKLLPTLTKRTALMLNKGGTSFTAQGLDPDKRYGFILYAYDEAGNVMQYNLAIGKTLPAENTSSTSSRPMTDAERKNALRQYLREKRSGDRLDNAIVSTVDSNLKEFIISRGQAMQLTNRVCDINDPRSEFMPINESSIYPGRLVYVNRSLIDGKIDDVQFYTKEGPQTGRVTVNVNFIAGNGETLSEKNVEATATEVNNAIGRIITKALGSGALPPASADSTASLSNSKAKLSIDLGCSVDYLGTKCKVDTNTTKTQESFYQIDKFTQGFYQVSVEAEDRDSVNFLGAGVTLQNLADAYKEAPIGIIKSVTYGRTGFNVKQYDASSFSFTGDQSVSYKSAASVTSKQDIQENSRAASHYARIWGGSATNAGKALLAGRKAKTDVESKEIDSAFLTEMSANMEVSKVNQGVPISFTVVYLASGKEATTKMTGKYVETEYVPLFNRASVYLKNDATTLLGTESVNVLIEPKYIKLDSNGKVVGEGWATEFSKKWNNNSSMSTNIQLPPNCYFKDNKLYVYLRTRKANVKGVSWKRASEGWVDLKRNGYLGLKILGNYLKNQLSLGGDSTYSHFV